VTTAEVDLSASKYTEALARAVAAQAVSLKLETWEGLRALGPGMRTLRTVHRAVEAEGECMCGGAGACRALLLSPGALRRYAPHR
jgi:hypothetical protein